MDIKLTKDGDKLLCTLYREYLQARKEGVTKDRARFFGSSYDIGKKLFPDWLPDDVDSECWGLHEKSMLECFKADCIAYEVKLSNDGIIYMENRFKDGIKGVLEFLANFIP